MALSDALLLEPYPFDVFIAARTDGVKGSGTINDPYNGSAAADFDARMDELPENTRVHLGPGTFLTKGYADGVNGGWQPKKGLKIVGSGLHVTTLRLTVSSGASTHFFAIGHALTTGAPAVLNAMDFLEVSDLTIDCNLADQTGSTFACGGVRIMGNHARVRRVRVINWGTTTSSVACYAIAAITGDPAAGPVGVTDCGIEDCIVVSPASSPVNSVLTALHAGPKDENPSSMAECFGLSPVIRNCFVDCNWPVTSGDFRGLSMSSCRAGIVEGNQIHNTKYGGPYVTKASIRDLVVRHTIFKNVANGPILNLGTLYPSSPASVSSLIRDGSIAVANLTNHGLQAGDRVKMDASAGSPAQFKGVFVVRDVTPPDVFRYQMTSAPSQDASSGTVQKLYGAAKVLIERNLIELATGGNGLVAIFVHDNGSGTSHPAPGYVHGEVLLHGNRIRYLDGAFENTYTGRGIEANGAKNLLVRNNVLECYPPDSLRNARCGSVKYFNNANPAGVLTQGLNQDTNMKYDELETEAEDAFVLAMFSRRR